MLRIMNMNKALRAYRTLYPEYLAYIMPEYGYNTHKQYLSGGTPSKKYLLLLAFKLRELNSPIWRELVEDV